MSYEIHDDRKWRISKSGFSIKTGWATDARQIAAYPTPHFPLDAKRFQEWMANAERICDLYNATLEPQP